jgi:CheY-like chemotaxis protein
MIKKVLLVDDDREMMLDLKESLSRRMDAVGLLTAGNGREALECLRSQEIALVVTDLKMPEMDGLELLAAMMQRYGDIPVIVMTGYSTPETERLARQGGAVDFIAKPFSVDALARRVTMRLNQQSEGGTLHNVSSAMFLQLIEMEQRTCTVRLERLPSGTKGILSFVEGELFDARLGDVQGQEAAYEILGWESVSIALQNNCLVRENRIRTALCPLILEAARRRDEKASTPATAAPVCELPVTAATPADLPAQFRTRIEKALGAGCGVEDIMEDPAWSERLKRISRYGQQLNLGQLMVALVNWGDSRDHIVRPGEPPIVVVVGPKCPREKLVQLLSE